MNQDFLVEIGTEELPPTSLLKLSKHFSKQIKAGLEAEGLSFDAIESFATPRRLAAVVKCLDEQTASKEIIAWGPPKKIAFDEQGQPSKAAIAFAKKNGISIDELQLEHDGKAEKLVHRSTKPGKPVAEFLPAIIQTALDKLPIAKRHALGR